MIIYIHHYSVINTNDCIHNATGCIYVILEISHYLYTHTYTHTYICVCVYSIHAYTHTKYCKYVVVDRVFSVNWLNTEGSINYTILTILKKTITYNLPYNLRNKIKHKPNTRLLRNNNSTILHQPIYPLHQIRK